MHRHLWRHTKKGNVIARSESAQRMNDVAISYQGSCICKRPSGQSGKRHTSMQQRETAIGSSWAYRDTPLRERLFRIVAVSYGKRASCMRAESKSSWFEGG